MEERYIVLIEDNADDAYLATRVIGKLSPDKVIVARDGEEAEEMLNKMTREEAHKQIHLVLLDLKLPKVSGLEVLQSIRTTPELQDLEVVVLTSSEDEGDQERCRELGVRDYLFKPLTVDSWGRVLRRIEEELTARHCL